VLTGGNCGSAYCVHGSRRQDGVFGAYVCSFVALFSGSLIRTQLYLSSREAYTIDRQ